MSRFGLLSALVLSACAAVNSGCRGSSPTEDVLPLPDGGGDLDGGLPDGGLPDGGGDLDGGLPDGGPTIADRTAAASATAQTNSLCTAIAPFYWEIGDQSAALGSGSVNGGGGLTYSADTVMAIASASKWIYSTYFVQRTNGALTADDIKFFNFWSGYTDFTGCPSTSTVGSCLAVMNPDGTTNGTFEPGTENKFDYGGGHLQKHAALNGLANLGNAQLAAEIGSQIGTEINLGYSQPQLAGGAYTSAAGYSKMLRKILSGQLVMKGVLGTHPVCTDPGSCALSIYSPLPSGQRLHYSIGHWVEDDPSSGDGAFSSPGSFGFYPWIDSTKTLYGILARKSQAGSGFDSLACGRLIRKAWVTGLAQ